MIVLDHVHPRAYQRGGEVGQLVQLLWLQRSGVVGVNPQRRPDVVVPVGQLDGGEAVRRVDADGEVLSRRRSPKRGDALDIFGELVSIPQLIAHPGFELELVLTVEDEYRKNDPSRASPLGPRRYELASGL